MSSQSPSLREFWKGKHITRKIKKWTDLDGHANLNYVYYINDTPIGFDRIPFNRKAYKDPIKIDFE